MHIECCSDCLPMKPQRAMLFGFLLRLIEKTHCLDSKDQVKRKRGWPKVSKKHGSHKAKENDGMLIPTCSVSTWGPHGGCLEVQRQPGTQRDTSPDEKWCQRLIEKGKGYFPSSQRPLWWQHEHLVWQTAVKSGIKGYIKEENNSHRSTLCVSFLVVIRWYQDFRMGAEK